MTKALRIDRLSGHGSNPYLARTILKNGISINSERDHGNICGRPGRSV
jgi:hypothetical protein